MDEEQGDGEKMGSFEEHAKMVELRMIGSDCFP